MVLASDSSARICQKLSVYRLNLYFLDSKISKALRKVRKYLCFITNLNSKKVKLRYFELVFAHCTEFF